MASNFDTMMDDLFKYKDDAVAPGGAAPIAAPAPLLGAPEVKNEPAPVEKPLEPKQEATLDPEIVGKLAAAKAKLGALIGELKGLMDTLP